jgi:hypothetical protein
MELNSGTVLRVVEAGGNRPPKLWKVMEVRERGQDHHYYDPASKKSYTLSRVMKSKRLYKKNKQGMLLHIPPCEIFLVIDEMPADGSEAPQKRCVNFMILETLESVEAAGNV